MPTATHTIGIYGSRNADGVRPGHRLCEHDVQFRAQRREGHHDPRHDRDGKLQRLPRPVVVPWRLAPRHDMCMHVPPAAEHRSEYRQYPGHESHGSQDPHGRRCPASCGHALSIPWDSRTRSVNYSTVVFRPIRTQRCTMCHSQTTGAAQATAYMTNPTRAACGSCHDDVNFATGANHPAGSRTERQQCSNCHIPQGEMDFDASIVGAHVVPTDSSPAFGPEGRRSPSVTNGAAGNNPTVTFTADEQRGRRRAAFRARFALADHGRTDHRLRLHHLRQRRHSTPGYVTESATGATCTAAGTCTYTFTHAVPPASPAPTPSASRRGAPRPFSAGQPNQQSIEYGAPNPVSLLLGGRLNRRAAANGGGARQLQRVPRRPFSCTARFATTPEYCVMCHNPSNTDATTRATATVAADKALPNQGIDFNKLVHRIHFGPNAAADGAKYPYIVVGFGGSHQRFLDNFVPAVEPDRFGRRHAKLLDVPRQQQRTEPAHRTESGGRSAGLDQSHPAGGWRLQRLPHVGGRESHFLANTTTLGESCTVCHSSGAAYAVDAVHAQY